MPVVGVAETIVPQGFDEPVQAVPLRLHVTAVLLVLLTSAVKVVVCVTYATAIVPLTLIVMGAPGPLPPVAHPLARARLMRAAANRKFLVIIEPR